MPRTHTPVEKMQPMEQSHQAWASSGGGPPSSGGSPRVRLPPPSPRSPQSPQSPEIPKEEYNDSPMKVQPILPPAAQLSPRAEKAQETRPRDVDVNVCLAEDAVLLGADGAEEPYVPLELVTRAMNKMTEDMEQMRTQHLAVISQVEGDYKHANEEQQAAFQEFLAKLKKQTTAKSERAASKYETLKAEHEETSAALQDLLQKVEEERSRQSAKDEDAIARARADGSLSSEHQAAFARQVENFEAEIAELKAQRNATEKKLSEALQRARPSTALTSGTAASGGASAEELKLLTEENNDLENQLSAAQQKLASAEVELADSKEAYAFLSAKYDENKEAYKKLVEFIPPPGADDADMTPEQKELVKLKTKLGGLEGAHPHLVRKQEESKKVISKWAKEFNKENGRMPAKADKKTVKPLYQDLEKADSALKANESEQEDARMRIAELEGQGVAMPRGNGGNDSARLELEKMNLQQEKMKLEKELIELRSEHRKELAEQERSLKQQHTNEVVALRNQRAEVPPLPAGTSAPAPVLVEGGSTGGGADPAVVAAKDAEIARLEAKVAQLAASHQGGRGGGGGGGEDSPVVAVAPVPVDNTGEITSLREKNSKLAEDNDTLEKTVAELRAQVDAATAAAAGAGDGGAVETELLDLQKNLTAAEERASQAEDALDDAKTSLAAAEAEDAKLRVELAAAHEAAAAAAAASGEQTSKELQAAREAATAAEKKATQEQEAMQQQLSDSEAEKETITAEKLQVIEERDALLADKEKLEKDVAVLAEQADAAARSAAEVAALTQQVAELQTNFEAQAVMLKTEQTKRKQLHNKIEDMLGKIRVYARVRPMNQRELDNGSTKCVTYPDEFSMSISQENGAAKDFLFDQVFPDGTPQEHVYNQTTALIQSALDGFNVCIFAYGQTGSGKTFTMSGVPDNKGIIPRAFEQVFRTFKDNAASVKYSLKCYMLELYNKKLVDLLIDPSIKESQRPNLDIKMDKSNMVYVKDVTMRKALSFDELNDIFEEGCTHRHTGSTKMNAESSRSHLVFSMVIEAKDLKTGKVSVGKLSLVDLAGSESVGKTEATGERLKEAQAINSSLSALGNVISKLAKQEKFIPYRDDKLTLLMMDSLGGNAKTLMFVNLSPADFNRAETISSLQYASRVKEIKNDASKNVESAEVARLKKKIKQLMGEKADEDV